jgi:hypothetical protein
MDMLVDSGSPMASVKKSSSPNSIWNDQALSARLIELSNPSNHYSSSDIAKILAGEFHIKITRNAVIGRCNRNGIPRGQKALSRRTRKASPKKLTIARNSVRPCEKSFTFSSDPSARLAPSPLPEPVRVPLRRATANRSVVELEADDCRYPVGTRVGEFGELIHVFCCQFKKFDSHYCPAHHSVVYTRQSCREESNASGDTGKPLGR